MSKKKIYIAFLFMLITLSFLGCSQKTATPDACIAAALSAQELLAQARNKKVSAFQGETMHHLLQILADAEAVDEAFKNDDWNKAGSNHTDIKTLETFCRNQELTFEMTKIQLSELKPAKTTRKKR